MPGTTSKRWLSREIPADLEQRGQGAGFGVVGAEHDASDSGVDQRAGAHCAGLERREHGASFEPPMTQLGRCGTQGQELGVCGRVGVLLTSVVISRQLDAVRTDDHAADGHIAMLRSEIGFAQRLAHPRFVARLGAGNPGLGHGSRTLTRSAEAAFGFPRYSCDGNQAAKQ